MIFKPIRPNQQSIKKGHTHKHKHTHKDITNTRMNWSQGQFSDHCFSLVTKLGPIGPKTTVTSSQYPKERAFLQENRASCKRLSVSVAVAACSNVSLSSNSTSDAPQPPSPFLPLTPYR